MKYKIELQKDMQLQEKKNKNKIKRRNTKLKLVHAKLQYLPSIGADLSHKESIISG